MNHSLHKPKKKHLKEAARWFARIRSGEFSQTDRVRLSAWLEADPAHKTAFSIMETGWQEAGRLDPTSAPTAGCFFSWPRLQKVGLAMLMILGVFLFRADMEQAWIAVAGQEKQYSTAVGETRRIELEDGSVLEMNTNTVLTTRLSWKKRRVDLTEGEVFFRVAREPERPFEVVSHQGVARVLGTSFHVRSRGGLVSVDVAEGQVRVETVPRRNARGLARRVNLHKGQGVDYGWSGGMTATRTARLEEAADWREGKIVFLSMRLADVLRKLKNYYGVQIRLVDPDLRNERFTGVFTSNDLDEILEAITVSFGLTSRTDADGSRVLVRKRG